jgi:hypothetical protein
MRLAGIGLGLLALAGCRGDSASPPDGGRLDADPMAFVELFHSDVERVLAAAGDDCQRLYRALRRFVAERGEDFRALARRSRLADPVMSLMPSETTEALMGFAARCPAETARLNEALWDMVR